MPELKNNAAFFTGNRIAIVALAVASLYFFSAAAVVVRLHFEELTAEQEVHRFIQAYGVALPKQGEPPAIDMEQMGRFQDQARMVEANILNLLNAHNAHAQSRTTLELYSRNFSMVQYDPLGFVEAAVDAQRTLNDVAMTTLASVNFFSRGGHGLPGADEIGVQMQPMLEAVQRSTALQYELYAGFIRLGEFVDQNYDSVVIHNGRLAGTNAEVHGEMTRIFDRLLVTSKMKQEVDRSMGSAL
jgi:hypothetical protein